MINIALNGFGRIGRNFLRSLITDKTAQKTLNLVALNIGPANLNDLVYSVKYDSLMGTFDGNVSYSNDILTINNLEIKVLTECNPENLPWKDLQIYWVVEATGRFTNRPDAKKHLEAGAKKVLISAPATDEDCSIVPGVNDEVYKNSDTIISLGSCTTNALAPTLYVINNEFGIESGALTTIHSYTNSQVLLDVDDTKTRLTRAAAINMIPSSTGATKVIGKVIPELKGKIIGNSVRIPIPKISLIDVVVKLKKEASKEAINKAFEQAKQNYPVQDNPEQDNPEKNRLKGILDITYEPLVSIDYYGNPHSVIIDAQLTETHGNLAKIFGWYDNEWAYSVRMKEFLIKHR